MWIDAAVAGELLADVRLARSMMAAAEGLLGDRLDGEDAVQSARDSLLASFTPRPREVENFAPYAVAAAIYSAIRIANANARAGHTLSESDDGFGRDPKAEDAFDAVDDRLRLADCLGRLTPSHRMSLIMHANGMTYAEIGDQLGQPRDTVRGWLPKTRARMRRCLEGRGDV